MAVARLHEDSLQLVSQGQHLSEGKTVATKTLVESHNVDDANRGFAGHQEGDRKMKQRRHLWHREGHR